MPPWQAMNTRWQASPAAWEPGSLEIRAGKNEQGLGVGLVSVCAFLIIIARANRWTN